MTNRVCVIGLGNMLLRDDAIGLHVTETIKESYRFEPEIDLLDGGTAGLDLLPVIEGYEKVLFVDAVDAGEPPGAIVVIEGDAIPSFLAAQASVHHLGLSDLLFAARMAERLPAEVCLVGIQPESIRMGVGMTAILRRRLRFLVTTVLERLRKWSVEPVQL